MKKPIVFLWQIGIVSLFIILLACDDDSDADSMGIGAECTDDSACTEKDQKCLTQFKGGYCGKEGCLSNADCPDGSACVAHDDSHTYCFRICRDKVECNRNRQEENEANCSSNIDFVDSDTNVKACVPPSSGDDNTEEEAEVSDGGTSKKDDKSDK